MPVHYRSDAGSHGVTTGRVESGTIVFAGLPRSDGAPSTRTVWTRTGPDRFRVVQQRRDGEQWTEALALTSLRSGPSPGD